MISHICSGMLGGCANLSTIYGILLPSHCSSYAYYVNFARFLINDIYLVDSSTGADLRAVQSSRQLRMALNGRSDCYVVVFAVDTVLYSNASR
jgi:hypothetical protein